MIRIGIGGWTFEPWRGVFYPEGLAQKRELEFATSKVTSIEINGTYYGSQKPASFRKWAEETPDDFIFTLKGPRFTTNRRVLAEAGESIGRFFDSGVTELGKKLGPINWQFMATKQLDLEDFAAFLNLLPKSINGVQIRHAVEVRHPSFRTPAFIDMARRHNVAIVAADSPDFPQIFDPTGDFIYARLQNASEIEPDGYSSTDIDLWAKRVKAWESGASPADLSLVTAAPSPAKPRDVFLYMINGFKPKAPAAAMALIANIG